MKKLIMIMSVWLLASCHETDSPTSYVKGGHRIHVIDSCEYIVVDSGIGDTRVYGITHKGNCVYCERRNNR